MVFASFSYKHAAPTALSSLSAPILKRHPDVYALTKAAGCRFYFCFRRSQMSLQSFRSKPRRFFGSSGTDFRSPPEFLQEGIVFAFDGVSDDFAQNGSEFESVAAVACRQNQAGPFRIRCNPKIAVVRIAIHTNAGINNGRVQKRGKCSR